MGQFDAGHSHRAREVIAHDVRSFPIAGVAIVGCGGVDPADKVVRLGSLGYSRVS